MLKKRYSGEAEEAVIKLDSFLKALTSVYYQLDGLYDKLSDLVFSYDHVPLDPGMGSLKKVSLCTAQIEAFDRIKSDFCQLAQSRLGEDFLTTLKEIHFILQGRRMMHMIDSFHDRLKSEVQWIMQNYNSVKSGDWKENRRIVEQSIGRLRHEVLVMIFALHEGADPLSMLKRFFPDIYRKQSLKYRACKKALVHLTTFLEDQQRMFMLYLSPKKGDLSISSMDLVESCENLCSRFEKLMASFNSLPDPVNTPANDPNAPLRNLFYSDLQDIHSIHLVLPRICGVFRKAVNDGNSEAILLDARSIEVHLDEFRKAIVAINDGLNQRLLKF
jgi:hypothetical protein